VTAKRARAGAGAGGPPRLWPTPAGKVASTLLDAEVESEGSMIRRAEKASVSTESEEVGQARLQRE
jgi:hypothetical protein